LLEYNNKNSNWCQLHQLISTYYFASSSGTVVEHFPQYPKVEGSNPAATASTSIEKNGKISELVKIFRALASG
jgi:hypothetical protein